MKQHKVSPTGRLKQSQPAIQELPGALTVQQTAELLGAKPIAFVATIDHERTGMFAVGLAEENENGYYPQPGFGSYQTYEAASQRAHELNCKLGLTAERAAEIVCSSMRKGKGR